MRLLTATCLLAIAMPSIMAQENAARPELKTVKDKISYAFGMNIGRQFQRQKMDLDPTIVARGIATILEGKEPVLTEDEIKAAFQAFEEEKSRKNLEDGNAFLAANAKKEGVKVTRSGLQYKVFTEGTGQTPTAESTVVTHYRGQFIDGTVFDQSYEGDAPTPAEEPISFGIGDVIRGWTEGLQLMKEGAKYRFFVPAAIAYKAEGRPGVPPNSTLIFDVELVKVRN